MQKHAIESVFYAVFFQRRQFYPPCKV